VRRRVFAAGHWTHADAHVLSLATGGFSASAHAARAPGGDREITGGHRLLLRDATVIGTGVLGSGLIFHSLTSAVEDSSHDAACAAEGADLDFGSDL
jgi:hypothetical protein